MTTTKGRPPLSPALVAELRARDPEYRADQKPKGGRRCIDCGRPMLSQRIYNADPEKSRSGGYVRHGADNRCNACYSARLKGRTCKPRFRASAVRITPSYPVTCEECGPVGEPHQTRRDADWARQKHVDWHRKAAGSA